MQGLYHQPYCRVSNLQHRGLVVHEVVAGSSIVIVGNSMTIISQVMG